MKIVIATAVYYPMINGVAVFSHNLAMGLAARGHEVLVLCPSQTGRNYTRTKDGVKVCYLKSIDVKVYPDQINKVPPRKKLLGVELPHLFYKKGLKVSVFPIAEIKKILGKFCPDVVHVQVSDPIGLSVVSYARKHHIPVVTTEHNQPEVITESLKMPGVMRKPVNVLLSSYFRNRQSKSDFVTMPTEKAIRNLLKDHELGIPIAAVSNGVDLTHFKPGRAPAYIYRKYSIEEGSPIVLYVGRIDPEKRLDLVISAFKEARRLVPQAQLIVVGDGVARGKLEKMAEDLNLKNNIRFLGRIMPPDLYELYKVGTVFATASEIETQGIVLIEAAATGLPLIAVDKGAVSEICVNGENGFLCQPGNVKEIGNAMVKILTNEELQRRFSEGSTKIAARHDLNQTIDKFINIYQRVIG